MKTSSKKTMLTAAVLVALSSGTTYAATPGTVDTQELFHSDHLVTDHSKKPAMEETAATDRYEASISQKKNLESAASAQGDLHGKASEPTRLRWESVDTSIAERNAQPSFVLAVQKPKPVIITAEDVKREEKQAVKEGRPAQELVGEVNMQRELPPQAPTPPVQQMQVQNVVQEQQPIQAANTQDFPAEKTAQTIQPKAEQSPSSFHLEEQAEQRPLRPHYPEMPHKSFSLMSPVDVGALPKLPERAAPKLADGAEFAVYSVGTLLSRLMFLLFAFGMVWIGGGVGWRLFWLVALLSIAGRLAHRWHTLRKVRYSVLGDELIVYRLHSFKWLPEKRYALSEFCGIYSRVRCNGVSVDLSEIWLAGKAGGKNVRLLEADFLLRNNRQAAEITAKQISRATGLPLLEYVSEDREGAT